MQKYCDHVQWLFDLLINSDTSHSMYRYNYYTNIKPCQLKEAGSCLHCIATMSGPFKRGSPIEILYIYIDNAHWGYNNNAITV